MGNYAEIFEPNTVYTEFLPMFFKFCSDNVVRVAYACTPAMASIICKFNDDESKQSTIVKVIKTKYLKAKTYKKRQLFAMMMINIMQKKEVFEKYFKLDFLNMVNDRVPNVRICVAKTLRHHFVKEIAGEFVYDPEVMGAVRVMKLDTCEDVKSLVGDIEIPKVDEEISMDTYIQMLRDMKVSASRSDTDSSINSEDEQRIENEIKRHDSEDDIDRGPVLKKMRSQKEIAKKDELEAKKAAKAEK